jgi:hypothetical protein
MIRPRIFAKPVAHMICLVIESLIVCAVTTNSAIAQSTDINNYWPLHAAKALGVDVSWPVQYGRAS